MISQGADNFDSSSDLVGSLQGSACGVACESVDDVNRKSQRLAKATTR